MFLPPEYAWFEPVAIGMLIVLVVCWLAGMLTFSYAFLTALTAALIFAVIFAPLAYFRIVTLSLSLSIAMPSRAPATVEKPAAPVQRVPPANPVTTVPNQ